MVRIIGDISISMIVGAFCGLLFGFLISIWSIKFFIPLLRPLFETAKEILRVLPKAIRLIVELLEALIPLIRVITQPLAKLLVSLTGIKLPWQRVGELKDVTAERVQELAGKVGESAKEQTEKVKKVGGKLADLGRGIKEKLPHSGKREEKG